MVDRRTDEQGNILPPACRLGGKNLNKEIGHVTRRSTFMFRTRGYVTLRQNVSYGRISNLSKNV